MDISDSARAQGRHELMHVAPDVLAVAQWLSFAPRNTFDFLDEAARRWPGMSLQDFRQAHYVAVALIMPTRGNA